MSHGPLPPALADRIMAVTRGLAPDHIWTGKMVGDALVEAVRLCFRIGGPVGPTGDGAAWPALLREWSDLLAQIETNEIGKDEPPRRYAATRAEVSRMERAIAWQARYLSGDRHEGLRRVLALWVRCKSRRGASFREALRRRRWSPATAYRLRDRALLIIAVGLMEDGVLP